MFYDWEKPLVEILKNHSTNIISVVEDKLMPEFGCSKKTWKNRISDMKKKHGFVVESKFRGTDKKEGWTNE